jgi:peptidoglycan/LPS O-acetylase OafA/YrhL
VTDKVKAPTEAQIEALISVIERVERRRRITLAGYLVALVVLLGGMACAFYVYGTAPRDGFWGWVFLIPFGLVGGVLLLFGRIARRTR